MDVEGRKQNGIPPPFHIFFLIIVREVKGSNTATVFKVRDKSKVKESHMI